MKVNSLQRMASTKAAADAGAPGLRRSASAKQVPSPSPLSGNASSHQQQPPRASTSTGPAYPRHAHKTPSISCKAATSTDTPPATPRGLTKQPSSASSSSYYASMFSPRKLMQRASRAFRGSGRSRRKKNAAAAAAAAAADGGDVDSPRSVVSKGSDADSVFSLDDQIIADGAAASAKQEEEVVPEKIIHEANPSPAPVAVEEEKDEGREDTPEKEASAAVEEAEPKKESAPPAPEAVIDEIAAAKEAVKGKEQREEEIKAEVVKRFQGRRVRTTSTERRESARSNEAIEEARTKLLELRQGNRVKALVGAFETVMDDNHRRAASGKPQLNLRV